MKPSASRILLASLGILVASPFARADALSDGRAALAEGDFATAKTQLDSYLANAANPNVDDARVLRAFARLGLAIQDDLPVALRTKLGANVAELDLGAGRLALRFPRPYSYTPVPGFTTVGSYYQYDPTLDLYAAPPDTPQPSISFENRGATAYSLTLVVSQPGAEQFEFDSILYLDGLPLGYVNTLGNNPFQVFTPPLFQIHPDIPEPFDLDLSVPEHYLSAGAQANSFTVVIPPKSNFTVGLVVSPGNLRFTPTASLPSSVVVRNGKAGNITPPRVASGANFSSLFTLVSDLDSSSLTPAIADLESVTSDVHLVLQPEETGAAIETIIAYPDVQLLLFELKFLQGFRLLGTSYKLNQPLTPAVLGGDLGEALLRNSSFLTPFPASKTRAADRALARTLLQEATDHYQASSDAGLWTRSVPLSGTYLFSVSITETAALADTFDMFIAQFRTSLSEPLPIEGDSDGPAFSFAPLFGSPALNFRRVLPIITDNGVLRGSSTPLLTSGLIQNMGTAGWESFLADQGRADLTTPALISAPKIQRQPAALTSVEEGEPATLRVVAESYPAPTYQWFRGTGKTATPIENATGPSLFFEETSREDAGRYSVRVTSERIVPPRVTPIVTTVTSTPAVLYVTYAPEVVTHPADAIRYAGKPVTLDVTVVGEPKPKSFQWFKGETAVTPVRKTSKYVFTATPERAGDYHVVVTNAEGAATSETATVEVQTKPVFGTHPESQTIAVGSPVTFTVEATGNPLPQIKWRKNGRDIPEATGSSYTIESVTLADRATYTAVAFGTVNVSPTATTVVSTTSAGATLTVIPAAP